MGMTEGGETPAEIVAVEEWVRYIDLLRYFDFQISREELQASRLTSAEVAGMVPEGERVQWHNVAQQYMRRLGNLQSYLTQMRPLIDRLRASDPSLMIPAPQDEVAPPTPPRRRSRDVIVRLRNRLAEMGRQEAALREALAQAERREELLRATADARAGGILEAVRTLEDVRRPEVVVQVRNGARDAASGST